MFSFRTHWYLLFDNEREFYDKFVSGNTFVHKGMFGEVILVKESDTYHAFKNRCPHQKKSMEGSRVECGKIICPHHKYAFSLENGRGHGLYLDKYELKFESGSVYLGKEKWSLF